MTASMISAEVILKAPDGRSLDRAGDPITSANVEQYMPAAETLDRVAEAFEQLGFDVARSEITLSLSGEENRFEDVFQTKLECQQDDATGMVAVRAIHPLVIPEALRNLVEQIVFPESPDFFP